MSLHKHEVVILKQCIKNCHGCGTPFADKHRSSPFNLVVRNGDRRVTGKNDYTGQLNYSRDFSNTYYHLSRNHIERKNPVFNGFFLQTFTSPVWTMDSVPCYNLATSSY